MATTTIPWGDGSGDNIYLTYPSASGNQTVQVTSDANTGSARSKVVTFSTGSISRQLTVNQEAGGPTQYTITLYPTSYDDVNYSWSNAQNISRGYALATSTTRSQIDNPGRGAEAYIFYKFDTSSIPDGATIDSVACDVKVSMNGNATTTPMKRVQMFSGLTPKGTETAGTTAVATHSLAVGTWTLAELRDARVRAYTLSGNTGSTYSIFFYGATLTITYSI